MHNLTADQLTRQPQQLIDSARRGEAAIVTVAGEPVVMALPLGSGVVSRAVLVALAATLFDCERISLGLAARIAALSYSEMVDELGRREIAVLRLEPGELERELASFGVGLAPSPSQAEPAMPILTYDELQQRPERLLEDARRSTPSIVTMDDEPLMLTLPLGQAAGSHAHRLELAVTLYECDALSLGLAATVAGLSHGQMIDELSRRQIPVVRYSIEDLDRELDYVRALAAGR